MPYYAYVLYSEAFDRFYKGHCENLNHRLLQHNLGKTKSTKPFIPWKIVYFEEFENRRQAIERERYFKTAAGRRFLKKKIITDKAGNRGSPPDRTTKQPENL